MKLSVQIPTFNRPHAMNRCLEHLAAQKSDEIFEIIVALDGDDSTTPDPIIPDQLADRTQVLRAPKSGYIPLRRRMLEATDAEFVLWMNDDAYADPGLIEAHLRVHQQRTPCVVSGHAQWMPIDNPDLFDRVVQTTDLIFFQSEPQTNTDPIPTDFRNCFGLNMSFPKQLALDVGAIPDLPHAYGYDDIELAHRLAEAGAELWRSPQAVVTHDHRFRPQDVHRREYLLGRSAWQYASLNPEFAIDVFKHDLRATEIQAYFTQSIKHERKDAERIERSFLELAKQPYDAISATDNSIAEMLAEHWIPLKRYLWKWGVLDAAMSIESRWSILSEADPFVELNTPHSIGT